MAVIRWLMHDWKHRQRYSLRLMKCVRFSLMPPWFLLALVKTTNSPEVEEMIDYPEVKLMIQESIK